MSDFSLDTGYGDKDWLASISMGTTSPFSKPIYADVSQGSQDAQPYTATGNGTGSWIDPATTQSIFGFLEKGLNYAIIRDQQKMTAVQAAPIMQAQAQATQYRATDNRVLMYAAMAAVVLYVVTR